MTTLPLRLPLRIAYADPPYPGCAHLYPEKREVDHVELLARLATYDGFVLHTSVPALGALLPLLPPGTRTCAWVKPFAAFKRNVSVAYAWEPVLFGNDRRVRSSSVTQAIDKAHPRLEVDVAVVELAQPKARKARRA